MKWFVGVLLVVAIGALDVRSRRRWVLTHAEASDERDAWWIEQMRDLRLAPMVRYITPLDDQ